MKNELSFVDMLNIVSRCSLIDARRNNSILIIIDNMMIPGSVNPLAKLGEDTLNRVFNGANSFSREYAKNIYSHKDEMRFSSFLRGLGEQVILNIETEIQDKESFYESDESCYKLAELMFAKVKKIADKPRAMRTIKRQGSNDLKDDPAKCNSTRLSVVDVALIAGNWNASNSKDIVFLEKVSGKKYEEFAKELMRTKIAEIKYPIWRVQLRNEYLDDSHKYLNRNGLIGIFEAMSMCMFGEDTCSLELMGGLAEFIAYTANNTDNVQYTHNDYNVSLNSFLRLMTVSLETHLSTPLLNVLPMLSEANMSYFLSVLSLKSISKQISSLKEHHKYCIQEVLIKAGEYDRFFIDASKALFDYSQMDKYYYQGFLSLFSERDSRTETNTDKKCGVLKGLVKRNPSFIKDVILDLLPGGQDARVVVPSVHYLVPPKMYLFDYDSYWKYETQLLDMLFEHCNLLFDDYTRLVRRLPYLSESLFDILINKLSTIANEATIEDREGLLEQLSTILIRGKVSGKKSESIQRIVENHDYSFVDCLGKELFSYSSVLFVRSSTGVFRSINDLENARTCKCLDIYKRDGIDGILGFLKKVEDKYSFGIAVFRALKDTELVSLIGESNDALFNRGLVSHLKVNDICRYDGPSFVEVTKYKPIDDSVIRIITTMPEDIQHEYWCASEGIVSSDLSLESWSSYIDNEMLVDHFDKVITSAFLHRDIIANEFPDKIYAALSSSAKDERISNYIYLSMIDVLRYTSYDLDLMVELEFLAIERYSNNNEYSPISIHTKMSQDPDFFTNVVQKSFKYEMYYSYILHTWRIVPGLSDTCFDITRFNAWYNVVISKSSDKILSSANLSVGRCLYGEYAKDWHSFLESELALILDNDDSDDIREGFYLAPEYCVVLSFDNKEMPQYDEYKKQADIAISMGLINVGSVLERIAYRFYSMYTEY